MTDINKKTVKNEQEKELEIEALEQIESEKQKVKSVLLDIDPKELKPHAINVEIYGDEDIDDTLLESIRNQGQLEPIMINQYNNIISGHRRWNVLLKLKEEEDLKKMEGQPYKKIEVTCIQKHYNDLLEEKEAIVEFNRQRKKNPLQIYNEIELLEDIYSEQAKLRKYENLPNLDVPDLEHRGEPGRTVKKEAKVVGLSEGTIANLKYIGRRAKEKNNLDAEYVMKEMINDRLSIDAGYKLLKLMEAAKDSNAKGPKASEKDKDIALKAQGLVDKSKEGTITPNKASKEFDEYKKNYENKAANPSKQTTKQAVAPEGSFNVFVLDPKSIEEAKNIQLPDSTDAAMFLWSTTHNLKERLDLMQSWGFNLKAVGIWNTGKTSTYFETVIEFLLLGIKGSLEPAEEYRPKIIFNEGYTHTEKKSELVYDIAEKMFPGQRYLDLYAANKRENWGQPIFNEIKEESKKNSKISTPF